MINVPADAAYCVYTHVLDGEVFYIGKGRLSRPFLSGGRNSLWAEKVQGRKYEINIVGWFAKEADALLAEKELIMMFRPSCNIVYSGEVVTERDWQLNRVKCAKFDAKRFLAVYFQGPANLLRMLTGYGFGDVPYETANKWFQRGRISVDWFPQMLVALELEHGEPVSLQDFIQRPGAVA